MTGRPPATDDERTPRQPPSQISEESWAYWRPIVAAMEPMTHEQLADVAAILRRIQARHDSTGTDISG
ncbi:hypothetical protein [Amycolatopsis jiangsuensis]|uniref:Uncharacterized protein n=1 Tax=Amycolatopsis jiangsuensis TaxID=1181879 RepID=A0A840ISI9_9PSEU|nr:hypothetical protein [Amycolatopsis jiangsuensis]MBB4683964.1 hypothetical protein [Amycolatopsis jiangsuensis]